MYQHHPPLTPMASGSVSHGPLPPRNPATERRGALAPSCGTHILSHSLHPKPQAGQGLGLALQHSAEAPWERIPRGWAPTSGVRTLGQWPQLVPRLFDVILGCFCTTNMEVPSAYTEGIHEDVCKEKHPLSALYRKKIYRSALIHHLSTLLPPQ